MGEQPVFDASRKELTGEVMLVGRRRTRREQKGLMQRYTGPPAAWLIVLLFTALGAGVAPAAWSAQALQQAQQPIANFAFASQLGAGVYAVDGRSIQIYRLPFHWELRPPTEQAVGLDITLPVTLGFFGYRVEDVVHEGLPKTIDTYSLLSGLEVSRLVHKWRVAGFAEVGGATARAGSGTSLIYDVGARARYLFPIRGWHARYATELLYAVSQVPKQEKDSMTRLTNGLDVLHGTKMSMRGQIVDVGPYALNEWYLKRPSPPSTAPGPPMAALQWEVGVTVGTEQTAYLWGVPIPRIGFGYRFGNHLAVTRLVFGAAF